jgi:arylsulfatase
MKLHPRIRLKTLFFKQAQNRALRVGAWKIVASGAAAPWELYDLDKDRAESHDLAARHPDKVKELAALWAKLDEEFRKQGATGAPLHPRP